MNKLLLFFVMLPSALWRSLGADTAQLRAILHAKLLVDDRKPLAFGGNRGPEKARKKDRKYTSVRTMLLSLFMGCIYLLPIGIVYIDATIGLSLFYLMFVFMLTFTLITDFANVLVDTKDKFILFARPVNDGTIMLSRLLYIFIYLMRVVIPMSIPAWVLFAVITGWKGALFFPFSVLLMVFLVLFIVCALYIIMLQIAGAGKFKDVLNYFQIGFSIVFFAVWMLSSRSMNPDAMKGITIANFNWAQFTPPYWMSVCWAWIDSEAVIIPGTAWTGVIAIFLPLVSLWATVKFLAPQFTRKLVMADNNNAETLVSETTPKKAGNVSSVQKLSARAAVFNKTSEGIAGFIITWLQTSRSRNFKMKVLPAFAYVPVYFFYTLSTGNHSLSETWHKLPQGHSYVGLLYLTMFVLMQAINYITMSEQYKAAWVYYATPVKTPGEVIAGAYKAMWVKYYMPFMLVIATFCIVIWGPKVLPDIVLATLNTTMFTVALMRISYRVLPFSKKEQMKDAGGRSFVRVMLSFILMGSLGLGHYVVASLTNLREGSNMDQWVSGIVDPSWLNIISLTLKIVFITLSAILLWLAMSSLRETTWSSIKNEELI